MSIFYRTAPARRMLLMGAAVLVSVAGSLSAAEVTVKPSKKLSYDPTAEKKELFAAIEDGDVAYKMIMKDSKQGNLILENKTEQPISVEMPPSFVGVQIFAQPGFGGGAGGLGGAGGGLGGGGQGGGGQQAVGGGAGGGLGGAGGAGGGFGGGPGGGGGGFFSIPAEKAILVPINTVCLEYGKREPSPRSTYKLVKTEEFTQDKTLQMLIAMIGTGSINRDVAQAAAWNVSSGLSWYELATKTNNNFGAAGPRNLFSRNHLIAAQGLVAHAVGLARQDAEQNPEPANSVPSRVNRVAR